VPLPHKPFSTDDEPAILEAFEQAYRTLFGRIIDGLEPEITNWSLIVASVLPAPEEVNRTDDGRLASIERERSFYDAALRREVTAKEVERSSMTPGAVVDGPAIIVERETSTIVTSAYRAIGQSDGCLLLIRKDAQ
jgi:N-methylhydantoinase A